MKNFMKNIADKFDGKINKQKDTIKFSNGKFITLETLENEYNDYIDLYENIEQYTKLNHLDSSIDYKKIMDFFKLEQFYWIKNTEAKLQNFDTLILKKIENEQLYSTINK